MFLSTGINDSPVIAGVATSAINGGAFKAVKFDSSGGIVLAGAGNNAIGLLIATTPDAVLAGGDVTVQIKEIGYWKAGDTIAAGAELTPDSAGDAVTAVVGDYVVAIALESATDGDIIKVQIAKCGQKGATTLDSLSDVAITTASNTQALKYDSAASLWKNAADATGISTLAGLTDVAITTPTDGQALKYDSATSKWINDTDSTGA